MVWGWQIAWYLFLGGLGAGATLTSLVASRAGSRFGPIERAGAILAGPAVAFGTALLVLDLGMGRREPWRLIYLYSNWQSPMTWGTWILTLFIPNRCAARPVRNRRFRTPLGAVCRAGAPGLCASPQRTEGGGGSACPVHCHLHRCAAVGAAQLPAAEQLAAAGAVPRLRPVDRVVRRGRGRPRQGASPTG